jgi:outer membrane protein TolC
MSGLVLVVAWAACRASAAPAPAALPVASAASSSAPLTAPEYVRLALLASPDVRAAEESLRAAEDAFNGQVAEMVLPTLAYSATKYPYGDDPSLGYQFHGLQVDGRNVQSNTTLNWNVFNGFQDWTNVRVKKEARESARHAFDAARQAAAWTALQAFYALSAQQRLRDVAREDLRAQEEQYRQTKGLYKDGLKSLADLFKSETEWHESQIRLVQSEAGLKGSLQPFNELISRPPWEERAIDASLTPGATDLPSIEEDAALLPERRPEILGALRDERGAEFSERLALLGLLPTVALNATWNHTDSYDGVSSSSLGIPNPNRYLGITLSLPLSFNGFTQAYAYAAARAARRQARDKVDSLVRSARNDLYAAWIGLESAASVYQLAAREVEIAEQGLAIVEAQYRQGTADALRMAQARADLLTARQQVETAVQSINVDRAGYRRAAGVPLW